MKIIECSQGDPVWIASRIGIPTSSNFDKIFTSQGVRSKSREKYLFQLAGERIVKKQEETFKSAAMQRGTEMEAEARSLYELVSGNTTQQVGFCLHDSGLFGCSPDSLVGDDGGFEAKCPMMVTQVSYLLDGRLPVEYTQQVFGSLLVTGRKWFDFFSYYPSMRPLIVRVFADKDLQSKFEVELVAFCKDLDELIKKIR